MAELRIAENVSIRLLLVAAAVFLSSCSQKPPRPDAPLAEFPGIEEEISVAIQAEIASVAKVFILEEAMALKAKAAYQSANFKPIWIQNQGASQQARSLIHAIEDSASHGLDPQSYYLALIRRRLRAVERIRFGKPQEMPAKKVAQLDILLTGAFFKLASHVKYGRVDPAIVDPEWLIPNRKNSLPEPDEMKTILGSGDVKSYINSIYPQHADYKRLRDIRKILQDLQKTGGWSSLPLDSKLRPSGHGGPLITVADRIRQVEHNLERWRWLPRDLGRRYFVVNVADYRLHFVENQVIARSMNVVVGQEYRRTPSFLSSITALDLNPKWVVPKKIVEKDLLPILKKNPQSLAKKGFRFYSRASDEEMDPQLLPWDEIEAGELPYRVIQDPGPMNALGKMKFWLPNRFGIFLHDTPSRGLFGKENRAFSSGCIRLENPLELAKILFSSDETWSEDALRAVIDSGKSQRIAVRQPIAIYLLYWTAWVDQFNSIQFSPDIYGRNWRLDEELRKAIP